MARVRFGQCCMGIAAGLWLTAGHGWAQGAFDGTYTGPVEIAPGGRPDCPDAGPPRTVHVMDSKFVYPHNRVVHIEATVAPDGTISGSAYSLVAKSNEDLHGKIAGGVIDGVASNRFRRYRFKLTKQP